MPRKPCKPSTSLVFILSPMIVLAVGCGQPEVETGPPPIVTLSGEAPVSVTGGQIQGSPSATNSDVIAFKGLPFAAPPVGDLRWQPPASVVAWDGVRDASAAGPICVQDGGQDLQLSEDCLFLNVWAPREVFEPLPVMVWIHGGGYFGGSGSTSLYDGTSFASKDVVLISINYRVNVFGFLAHPTLSAESPHDASGNYGLMDMVAALEWVRDNAETFGGDPNRVTIFGESAGAGAVMSMMLIPQSEGLFHRAIAQSNWVDGWDRQLRSSMGDWPSDEAQGVQVAEALGAIGDNALATMRAATSGEVSEAARAGAGNAFIRAGYVWAPNVDGWVIPDDPLLMYQNGRQHNVPLITGMNGNEGSLMTRQMEIDDALSFHSHVRTVYAGVADQAIALYNPTSPDTAKAAMDHLIHDMYFVGPVRTQATAHVKVTSPVWLYHFTRVPPTDWGSTLGSHHAAELTYVFGTMTPRGTSPAEAPLGLTTEGDWTDTDRELSEAMMNYWVQFAATGDPNREDLSVWPEFIGLTDEHLTFGDSVTSDAGLHNDGADLFNAFETHRRAGT